MERVPFHQLNVFTNTVVSQGVEQDFLVCVCVCVQDGPGMVLFFWRLFFTPPLLCEVNEVHVGEGYPKGR